VAQIDLPGVSLHYELSGRPDAPVLVLSNSLGTTLQMWNPQLEALERHFQLLRYDMRGHGTSSTPPGPYTIDQLGRDVLALLDALDIAKINFCGLSAGGVVGQWLGIHAGPRLSKLVLCNTAAKIGSAEIWNRRISDVESGGMQSITDGVLQRWFTADFLASGNSMVADIRQMLLNTPVAGYVATCAAIRDMDFRSALAAVQTPVCIVAGVHDMVTTLADAQFLRDRIDKAELASLPAAHISNVEAQRGFTEIVVNFLTKAIPHD
jgi:3-oxoadipate enol-lactonase